MKRTTTAILAALMLAAGAARAVAADAGAGAEDRFHQAYVTEVIDGKVADAAKVYLELMEADAAPPRIRAESKFRFAVCAALLGRADEAAAHLGALIADPATPEDLRTRAKAYLGTVEGIGVGSELTKKLESLVFELGRASPNAPEPEVYRDFEVIGKPAIPFLRKLLAHPDLNIRQHAFRILARMDADGVVEAWSPEIGLEGPMADDVDRWLTKHPGSRGRFEKRVLEASDSQIGRMWLGHFSRFSEAFLRDLAERDLGSMAAALASKMTGEEWATRLLSEWAVRNPGELGSSAMADLLQTLGRQPGAAKPPADDFRPIVERAAREPEYSRGEGITQWARSLPASDVLDAMRDLLDRSKAGEFAVPTPTLGSLALSLDTRIGDLDAGAYAALLRDWVETGTDSIAATVNGRLTPVFVALPTEDAAALAAWLFGDDRRPALDKYVRGLPYVTDEKSAAVVAAAFEAAPPALRDDISRKFLFSANPGAVTPDVARIQLDLLKSLLERGGGEWLERNYAEAGKTLARLPEEEAARRVVSLVGAGAGPRSGRGRILADLPVDVFLRAAPELVDPIGADYLVKVALYHLDRTAADPGRQRRLARFVLDHVDTAARTNARDLAARPDLFPLEAWIPEVAMFPLPPMDLTPERATEVARKLTSDPAGLTWQSLEFVKQKVPHDAAKEIAERLYRETTGPTLLLVHQRLAHLVDRAAWAAALARVMSSESPDLDLVAALAGSLAGAAPSADLFPAVRLLLESDQAPSVLAGIELARSLGREELLPALAGKLDSMVPSIREKAKAAMDSILELKRLRSEYEK